MATHKIIINLNGKGIYISPFMAGYIYANTNVDFYNKQSNPNTWVSTADKALHDCGESLEMLRFSETLISLIEKKGGKLEGGQFPVKENGHTVLKTATLAVVTFDGDLYRIATNPRTGGEALVIADKKAMAGWEVVPYPVRTH